MNRQLILTRREKDLVIDICHEVDSLLTEDVGTGQLEVLERARLKMNDLLFKKRYRDAENMAYTILLMRSGYEAEAYLMEKMLR